jgi:hypothetical protein
MKKSRGDGGQPCLSPVVGLKEPEVDPFMRIEKDIEIQTMDYPVYERNTTTNLRYN